LFVLSVEALLLLFGAVFCVGVLSLFFSLGAVYVHVLQSDKKRARERRKVKLEREQS
jgi:hypothetical protein